MLPTCLVWLPQHGQVMYTPLPCQEVTADEWAALGAGSEPGVRAVGGRRLAPEKPFRERKNVASLTQGKMGDRARLGRGAHVLVFNVGQHRE